MAIICNYKPSQFSRAYDTNICSYILTGTSYTQPNYTIYIEFFCKGIKIGSQKFYPNSSGVVYVNPTSLYKNYLSPSNQTYDLNLSSTEVTACPNSLKDFFMMIYESYGSPPTNHFGYMTPSVYFYNGCQQFIDYQAMTDGNLQWVINTGATGGFLSDISQVYLGNNDYYNLYFIAGTTINKIQYLFDVGNSQIAKGPEYMESGVEILEQSLTKGNPDVDAFIPPPAPATGTTVIETININQIGMYYIPIGPSTINQRIAAPNGWNYCRISLYYNSTKLNKTDFIIYNVTRDCRYPNYQVFWLNKHGGYDGMVWDKGNVVKNKIQRDTYKKSLFPNYNFQQAGELVNNIQVVEEYTLTTSLLNDQSQSQSIMGMFQSPTIFVLQKVNNVPYTVPYICVDNDVQYLQMVNDLAINYTCTLRPSNQRIEQSY